MGLCTSKAELSDSYQSEPASIRPRRQWSDHHLNKELTFVTSGIPEDFQYECMQCDKLKLDVSITTCCTRVIWDDWSDDVNVWPQRCGFLNKLLIKSMFISKTIESFTRVCPKCDEEVHQTKFKTHEEKCKKLYYERINFVGALWDIDIYSDSKTSSVDLGKESSKHTTLESPRAISPASCNWIKEFQFCTDWILQSVY